MITTKVESLGHQHWYVAFNDDIEICRVRISSHIPYIEDEERKAFLFRQVAKNLAQKVVKAGFSSSDMEESV